MRVGLYDPIEALSWSIQFIHLDGSNTRYWNQDSRILTVEPTSGEQS